MKTTSIIKFILCFIVPINLVAMKFKPLSRMTKKLVIFNTIKGIKLGFDHSLSEHEAEEEEDSDKVSILPVEKESFIQENLPQTRNQHTIR